MAEKSTYNIFEIKWFDEFLAAYKVDNVIRPDGRYGLCNPSLPKPVLDYVFPIRSLIRKKCSPWLHRLR